MARIAIVAAENGLGILAITEMGMEAKEGCQDVLLLGLLPTYVVIYLPQEGTHTYVLITKSGFVNLHSSYYYSDKAAVTIFIFGGKNGSGQNVYPCRLLDSNLGIRGFFPLYRLSAE